MLSGWGVFSSERTSWSSDTRSDCMMRHHWWWMMRNVVSVWWSTSDLMFHHGVSQWRAASHRWSTSGRRHNWQWFRSIHSVTNLTDLFLSVQVSSHNIVCLNEGVQLPLQVFVLLTQQQWVLLESFVLWLEIKISVHERLVWIVNSFQVCVLAALINLETVELGLKTLECRS